MECAAHISDVFDMFCSRFADQSETQPRYRRFQEPLWELFIEKEWPSLRDRDRAHQKQLSIAEVYRAYAYERVELARYFASDDAGRDGLQRRKAMALGADHADAASTIVVAARRQTITH
jgi:hypothetical protein